jgi:nucleoside permease NupC
MLAVIAMVVFIIGAVVGWVDKTISLSHLLVIMFAGLAFLAGHFIFRVFNSDGRW